MRIEAEAKTSGLNGGAEVWFRVLSNEVHDWPSIEKKLSGPQRVMLNSLGLKRTLSYFPHRPTAEERSEHSFSFEDWFVWQAPTKVTTV